MENDIEEIRLADFKKVQRFWDLKKNGSEKLDNYSLSSRRVFHWRCYNGHEWEASVASMFSNPVCHSCNINEGVEHFNIAKNYPEYAREWHHEKNYPLKPEQAFPDSPLRVWWKCYAGHEWEASIRNRIKTRHKCIYCRKALQADEEERILQASIGLKKRMRERVGGLSNLQYLVLCSSWVNSVT